MSILRALATNVFPLFREETEVARYLAIPHSVEGIVIPGPPPGLSDRHLQFDAPGVIAGSNAVVMFQTTPHDAEVTFSVRLNNTPHLVTATVSDGRRESWHEVAQRDALKPEKNELVLAVSKGSMTFSDVVILYRSNRLTEKTPINVVAIDQ